MYELLITIVAVISFGRMAEQDRGEGLKWGAITAGLCIVSFFIPLPFLRIILAVGLAFILMTAAKKTYY